MRHRRTTSDRGLVEDEVGRLDTHLEGLVKTLHHIGSAGMAAPEESNAFAIARPRLVGKVHS